MEKFAKLLESKARTQKPMSSPEKTAKMRAIHEMRKMASDEMALPLKNLKKVTVASDSPEGVKEGLDKAQDMMGHMAEGSPEEEMLESPEMEMSESGEHEEKSEEEMSPEELQMKIMELQKLLDTKKMS